MKIYRILSYLFSRTLLTSFVDVTYHLVTGHLFPTTNMLSNGQLHIKTPLIKSDYLTHVNHNIYFKMECKQLPGSFKIRGIGHHSLKCVERGCKKLIGCSGGNAGIAVAYAAKILKIPCTIYVPEIASKRSIAIMKEHGAEIIVHGNNYGSALKEAKKESEKTGNALIDAYDHPEIWEGHETIISELQEQVPQKPGIIIVPVGGGGLLCGILQGLEKNGWTDVPVLAMETFGAHCFNLSFKAKTIVPLEEITSIAVTLGAKTIPEHLLHILPKFNVISEVVSDSQAVTSCLKFAAQENTIVEPSCGAALAAIYSNILTKLIAEKELQLTEKPVVVIVSGGSGVTLNMLQQWAHEMNLSE